MNLFVVVLTHSALAFVSGYNGEMNPLTPNSEFYGVSQQDISRVLAETGVDFGLTVSGSRTESELAPWDEILEQSFSNSEYSTALTPEESFTAGLNLKDAENNGAESAFMSQVYFSQNKLSCALVVLVLLSGPFLCRLETLI